MLSKYAKGVISMEIVVRTMNEVFGAEEPEDTFELSMDEEKEHRIISLYETLGGTCLISVRFDKLDGELSLSSDEYVLDRFGEYTNEAASEVIGESSGGELDDITVGTAAFCSGLIYSDMMVSIDKFKEVFGRISDAVLAEAVECISLSDI